MNNFVLAICGEGMVGKDLAAEYFKRVLGLRYFCSTSFAAADLIFHEISNGKYREKGLTGYGFSPTAYKTVQECYEDRRNHRDFWAEWIRNFNEQDGSGVQLYRRSTGFFKNQILTGIRKTSEFNGCIKNRIINCSLGITREGVKRDQTFEYSVNDCDFIIHNPVPVSHGHSYNNMRLFFDKLDNVTGLFKASFDGLVSERLADLPAITRSILSTVN